jgi:hypothetical protein
MFVPWEPRVSREQVAAAINAAATWGAVLRELGYAYHGKNIATIRKWAQRWEISTTHLSDHRGRRAAAVRYTDAELEAAIAASFSWAEALRRLGYCPTGGNWKTLKRKVVERGISTDHFDPYAASRARGAARRRPLNEILVENSTYSRSHLKNRLYETELKERRCELCGQDELWNGKRISLILDHINGIRDDHRLENLRIVCPNCAAGLDTHCGRNNQIDAEPRPCLRCAKAFLPNYPSQRYCSSYCGLRRKRKPAVPRPERRRAERPPYEGLRHDVETLGYRATGRKYGVSDNAIRKWIRQYERERAVAEGRDPEVVEIPTRTWPNRRRAA